MIGRLLATLAAGVLLGGHAAPVAPAAHVAAVSISGLITSDSSAQLSSAIAEAAPNGDAAVLVTIDSPGGSPDGISAAVSAISGSPIPVIVYVGTGDHADAGALLVAESADVLAVAPDAQLGSVHPVAASLPTLHPADTGWDAVTALSAARHRAATPLSDDARLGHESSGSAVARAGAAEVLAASPQAALAGASGKRLWRQGLPGSVPPLSSASIAGPAAPGLRQRLADPDLVFVLLLVAVVLLGLWLSHPANLVVLVFCVAAAAAAAAGMTLLPLSPLAFPIAALGIVFLGIEVHAPTHGALTAAGAVLLAVAGSQLIDTQLLDSGVDPVLIAGTVLLVMVVYLALLPRLLEARRLPHRDPATQLVGRTGTVREALSPEGLVWLEGSLWRAVATSSPIPAGAAIRVVEVDGLTLTVSLDVGAKTSDRPTG